jgi:hypothetical protein
MDIFSGGQPVSNFMIVMSLVFAALGDSLPTTSSFALTGVMICYVSLAKDTPYCLPNMTTVSVK